MSRRPATEQSSSPAPQVDDRLNAEIRRLYEDEGWTGPEVARALACGTTTVYARLARLGVPRRPPAWRGGRPSADELRRLYEDCHLSLRQIGQRFSVTPQAVREWLIAAGIPRRPGGAPTPTVESGRLVELYSQGLSGPEVAARLGCSSATVYRRLAAAGIARRTGPAVDRQQLIEALAAGLSGPEIADTFGVSIAAVVRALHREGLETATQAARRRAGSHYAALLERAETLGTADVVTIEWLRHRVAPGP